MNARRLAAIRWCAVAMAQAALHEDAVEPAAVFVAHGTQQPDLAEADGLVEFDRGGIAAVADDRDHLAVPEIFAARHQGAMRVRPAPRPATAGST